MAGLRRRVGFDIIIIIPEASITFAARDLFCGHEGIRWSSGNGGMVSTPQAALPGGGRGFLFLLAVDKHMNGVINCWSRFSARTCTMTTLCFGFF